VREREIERQVQRERGAPCSAAAASLSLDGADAEEGPETGKNVTERLKKGRMSGITLEALIRSCGSMTGGLSGGAALHGNLLAVTPCSASNARVRVLFVPVKGTGWLRASVKRCAVIEHASGAPATSSSLDEVLALATKRGA
jgi:hypothetical protein